MSYFCIPVLGSLNLYSFVRTPHDPGSVHTSNSFYKPFGSFVPPAAFGTGNMQKSVFEQFYSVRSPAMSDLSVRFSAIFLAFYTSSAKLNLCLSSFAVVPKTPPISKEHICQINLNANSLFGRVPSPPGRNAVFKAPQFRVQRQTHLFGPML